MKKFLSLMLAMIMVMSLVTVGAGAAFTDAAEIENTEAVEVMNALGILQGSDGVFDPTGTLTRGAAAKIIAYMVNGTVKAEKIAETGLTEKPFPDVETTSATAPFIAWCAEQGIVGGYSSGNFERKDPVSGDAFIKMVLKALGEKEIDFTAKGWQVEAVAKAEEMGLLEGISEDVKFSANLSRENAAQIAFNGMTYVPEGNKYYLVGTEKFTDATDAALYASLLTPKGTVEVKTDLTKSLAGKNYKLATIEKVVVVSTPETADQDYTLVYGYDAVNKTYDNKVEYKFNFAASKELVGHVVNVYFKDDQTTGANKETGKYDFDAVEIEKSEEVYGMTALSKEIKTSTTNGLKVDAVNAMLGTKLTKDTAPAVKGATANSKYAVSNYELASGAKYLEYKVMPTYTGITVSSGTWIVYDNVVLAKKSTTPTVNVFEVEIDDDDYITVNQINEVAEPDPNDSTKTIDTYVQELVNKTAEDEDDCVDLISNEYDWASVIEENEDKGEVVLTATYVGAYRTVADIKYVTGKVTKVDTAASTKVIYIDGTKYQGNTDTDIEKFADFGLTEFSWSYGFSYTAEYNFYLDANGKVWGFERADGTTEGTVIVPIHLYGKYDFVEGATDEYGVADPDAKSSYSVWMQAIDMNGQIVDLQVGASREKVYAVEDDAKQAAADYATELTASFNALKNSYATYTTSIDPNTDEAISNVVAAIAAGTDGKIEGTGVVTKAEADKLSADSKKVADANGYTYYLNDGFKVIYIDGIGAKVKVTVKDGTYKQIVENAVLYGEKAEKDATSYDLKYVLVMAVAGGDDGDELMYIKSVDSKIAVPYTNKDGKVVTGYQNTGYINGEKVTILLTAAQAKGDGALTGNKFYEYTVNEDGTYTLTAPVKAVPVVENEPLDGNYKGLITVVNAEKQINVADYDATDAKIVNLLSNNASSLGYDDVPTAASKLAVTGTKVSFVYDKDAESIDVIYVIAYADQDK